MSTPFNDAKELGNEVVGEHKVEDLAGEVVEDPAPLAKADGTIKSRSRSKTVEGFGDVIATQTACPADILISDNMCS